MEAYRFRGGAHNHHGGNYGSRQQALEKWLRSYILKHNKKAETANLKMAGIIKPQSQPAGHNSSNEATHLLILPKQLPTGKQALKYMNLWGPFSIKSPQSKG